MMNAGANVNNQMIGILLKRVMYGTIVHLVASAIRLIKLTNIQILKTVPTKKILIGKLVLACEDEILYTTEASLNDRKSSMRRK